MTTTFDADAYEPATHYRFTVEAISQFKECFPNNKFILKGRNRIADYTEHEDSILHNFWRFGQWHFFSPKGDLGRSGLGFRISMDYRFHYLEKKLEKLISKDSLRKFDWSEIHETIGRLIHYVQDVTAPPHVMPIYHWSGKKDLFDGYPFDASKVANLFKQNKVKVCSDISTSNYPDLFSLLVQAAKNTKRVAVKEPLRISGSHNSDATWGLFWKEDKNCKDIVKEKFKDYGPLGNNYGNNHIWDRCDLPEGYSPLYKYCGGESCIIDKTAYVNFAQRRHQEAVNLTMKALYYLKLKLEEKL